MMALLVPALIVSCGSETSTETPGDPPAGETVPWNAVAVIGTVVNLRAGPGTQYAVLGQVRQGDSLLVTGGLDDWYRVYAADMSLFAWIYGPLTSGAELP